MSGSWLPVRRLTVSRGNDDGAKSCGRRCGLERVELFESAAIHYFDQLQHATTASLQGSMLLRHCGL